MKRVSALILFAAIGGNAFSVDGKALNQKPMRILPQAGRPETSLNQHRWDRDYRDNGPVGGQQPQYRQYQNNYSRSFGKQGGPYSETGKSTEEGWWNEERRNFKTSENRMDRRSYSNARNKGPISNNYDVTPDEWRGDDQRQFQQANYQQQQFGVGNQRQRYYDNRDTNRQYDAQQPRQTLRANDRDRQALAYNNGFQQENNKYDPNDVTPQEWKDQQQRGQGYNNNQNQMQMYNQGFNQNDGYYQDNGNSYGFGARGEVVGTYDQTVAYNTINNNGYDADPTPPEWKDKQRQFGRAGSNGYGADGLYDASGGQGGQGGWWNQERRNYSTNLGYQETRSYGMGSQTRPNDAGSVRPSEWEEQYGYNNRNQRPVSYDDRRGGDRPKNNWWDSVKNGFRNVSNNNRRGGYNDRREYVTQEAGYFDNSYNNNNYYNNNNNGQDYVTQDNDWWKKEKVDTTTW